jgi:hypothetical protein
MQNMQGSHPTAKHSILVYLQYMENYGAHTVTRGEASDELTNYWKFKGGKTLLVHNVDRDADALAYVMDTYCYSHSHAKQYISHWENYDGNAKEGYDDEVKERKEWEAERGWTLDPETYPVISMPD